MWLCTGQTVPHPISVTCSKWHKEGPLCSWGSVFGLKSAESLLACLINLLPESFGALSVSVWPFCNSSFIPLLAIWQCFSWSFAFEAIWLRCLDWKEGYTHRQHHLESHPAGPSATVLDVSFSVSKAGGQSDASNDFLYLQKLSCYVRKDELGHCHVTVANFDKFKL
jgi:hypothetical protein